MTLALDEMLGDIVAELQQEGVYDDTWIFLTSDNGQLRGEHGIGGKSAPYEESIVVPLYVRGPGVPAGVQRPHLVANIDIAPTVLDLAGASPTSGSPAIDGESIVGPVTGAVTESDWRDGILIEMLSPGVSPNREHITPRYGGVRSDQHVYIKYETTEREFYDLVNDPFQLTSYWPTAPSGLKSEHQELLQGLDNCAGSACADAARIDTGSPPTASFTVSCSGLECSFDASASSDPDGTIETYDWDFGDGTIAEGETTTHTYAAGGDYTVTLMVTDNDDLTDTETKTASPSSSGAVHEHGIDMLVNETQSTAIAKVWVRDDGGGLVEGATVTGTWSEDGQDLGTFTAVSNSAGKAKLVVGVDDPQGGENLEFCVTDITHPTLAYDAGSNVEGCDTILWPGGGASGTIHEDGIDMLTKQDNDNANAKVWVRNDSDALVEGATVTGTWTSNGTGLGSFSGVSAANGKAKIVVDLPGAQSGDVLEFCVTAMTHPSYTHDAGSNAETCDSITWS
jgi:PKD repeat protein